MCPLNICIVLSQFSLFQCKFNYSTYTYYAATLCKHSAEGLTWDFILKTALCVEIQPAQIFLLQCTHEFVFARDSSHPKVENHPQEQLFLSSKEAVPSR